MQQQSFTPIQKTEPKKIVVDEGQDGPRDNIENTETALSPFSGNLGAHRGVAVHVVDVTAQRGIRVVQQRMRKPAGTSFYFDRGMRPVLHESACAAAHQAQFGIGIKSAVPDPAP